MPVLPWKRGGLKKFDKSTLRKNDISILILDERWNKLFEATPKTAAIERCEQKLKDLIKEEARLTAEKKEIAQSKKIHMDKIIKLTPEVYDKNDEDAKTEMQLSENEIKRINAKLIAIEDELDKMPDRIRNANLELLEQTVNVVYLKIRSAAKRIEGLDKLIEETRETLRSYIDEKESLAQDDTDIYSYFHDLLGADELERLDKIFFNI